MSGGGKTRPSTSRPPLGRGGGIVDRTSSDDSMNGRPGSSQWNCSLAASDKSPHICRRSFLKYSHVSDDAGVVVPVVVVASLSLPTKCSRPRMRYCSLDFGNLAFKKSGCQRSDDDEREQRGEGRDETTTMTTTTMGGRKINSGLKKRTKINRACRKKPSC